MNHRKVIFRTLGGSIATLLALLAYAPVYQAGATSLEAPLRDIQAVVRNDEPAHGTGAPQQQLRPHARQEAAPHYPPAAEPATQPEQQGTPEQPDSKPTDQEFDGYTAFAMNESGSKSAFSNGSDAHIFGALGGGSVTYSSPAQEHHGFTPQSNTPAANKPHGKLNPQPSDAHDEPTPKTGQTPYQPNLAQQDAIPDAAKAPNANVPEPGVLTLLFIGICALIATRQLA